MEKVGESASPDAAVVRVLVVDDQAPFRAAARAVISRVPNFELRRPLVRKPWRWSTN